MLSILLLVPMTLCNAQWPIDSIGYEKARPLLRPAAQPGYPYDNAPKWLENVPNRNLRKTPYTNIAVPHTARLSHKPLLKLSEVENASGETLPIDKKISNDPEVTAADNSVTVIKDNTKAGSESSKHSTFSGIYKIAEDVSFLKSDSVKIQVTASAYQEPALRNATDQLMGQINLLYVNLAVDESDNEVSVENSYKYGMSVVLRFLLEFYRIFRKISTHEAERITEVDVYGVSYDKAVDVMKKKQYHSALQISAPVKRAADIFKSIIYQSVIIVQTKCNSLDPNWKCIIMYLANLISEGKTCTNIWYHAFLHIIALENVGLPERFIYKIVDLDKFKELKYFENIFEFIIEKLQEYREEGRVQLSAEAVLFTMIADLQDNDLLTCLPLDHFYD